VEEDRVLRSRHWATEKTFYGPSWFISVYLFCLLAYGKRNSIQHKLLDGLRLCYSPN